MKKAIMLTGVAVLSLLVICGLVFAFDNTNSTDQNGTNYSRCILSCVNTSQVNHAKCVDDYKNNTNKCSLDLKNCLLNNINSTNSSKKDISKMIKDCNKNYTKCKKDFNTFRDSCIKDANNDSKACKDQCQILKPCPINYNPTCGKDNKTYSNECELKKADILKDCKGVCPCIVPACNKKDDCKSLNLINNTQPYCSGNLSCVNKKTDYKCKNPGTTSSKCVIDEKTVCTPCANGCNNGTCIIKNESIKNYCKPSDRKNNLICPTISNPVCGWFSSSVECLQYPCTTNYPNSCFACGDNKVAYWTNGECPATDNTTNNNADNSL